MTSHNPFVFLII